MTQKKLLWVFRLWPLAGHKPVHRATSHLAGCLKRSGKVLRGDEDLEKW
jgi:hypothetical protein